MGEAPRLLPERVHRNSEQHNTHSDAPNNEERIPHALRRDPIVGIERHSEGEHVLNKVHDGEGFSSLLPVAVGHICYQASRAELHAEIDETHANNDWHGPGILCVQTLAPGEESGGREEEVCDHDR